MVTVDPLCIKTRKKTIVEHQQEMVLQSPGVTLLTITLGGRNVMFPYAVSSSLSNGANLLMHQYWQYLLHYFIQIMVDIFIFKKKLSKRIWANRRIQYIYRHFAPINYRQTHQIQTLSVGDLIACQEQDATDSTILCVISVKYRSNMWWQGYLPLQQFKGPINCKTYNHGIMPEVILHIHIGNKNTQNRLHQFSLGFLNKQSQQIRV